MRMYKSPIEIIYGQMQTQMEGDIFKAVQSYYPNVDKEELLRALQYDRNQYDKGYADGKRDAMDELVRCKNCCFFARPNWCALIRAKVRDDDFCSYGERKDNG